METLYKLQEVLSHLFKTDHAIILCVILILCLILEFRWHRRRGKKARTKKPIITSLLLISMLAGCGMPIEIDCPDECDELIEEIRLLREDVDNNNNGYYRDEEEGGNYGR